MCKYFQVSEWWAERKPNSAEPKTDRKSETAVLQLFWPHISCSAVFPAPLHLWRTLAAGSPAGERGLPTNAWFPSVVGSQNCYQPLCHHYLARRPLPSSAPHTTLNKQPPSENTKAPSFPAFHPLRSDVLPSWSWAAGACHRPPQPCPGSPISPCHHSLPSYLHPIATSHPLHPELHNGDSGQNIYVFNATINGIAVTKWLTS